ncbi:PssE/Cps14G family polysaccharide biosynthesis glycosyltransferase [Paenibacillus soyae]|uniref:Glycosyltransferase family 28 n=1 Tax=Paenibacillus soyae TaxID=2969249 RepID=A0A9X2MWW7_9BACL|nr:PssE/Cps14G family polysaccharide biosynthesis glycosyltransferase [Paenibacillus soyae]MCR2807393.1 glycosyltransferase family 28 [Paenibacillus soyae]
MIFLTIGTQRFPFGRLLETVDLLIENKIIQDKVIAQIGYTEYKAKQMETFQFADAETMDNYLAQADLLICHAGVGTITKALSMQKKVLIFPREKKFGEHVDDHQSEIAAVFKQRGHLTVAHNYEEMKEQIMHIYEQDFVPFQPQPSFLLDSIRDFVVSIDRRGKLS